MPLVYTLSLINISPNAGIPLRLGKINFPFGGLMIFICLRLFHWSTGWYQNFSLTKLSMVCLLPVLALPMDWYPSLLGLLLSTPILLSTDSDLNENCCMPRGCCLVASVLAPVLRSVWTICGGCACQARECCTKTLVSFQRGWYELRFWYVRWKGCYSVVTVVKYVYFFCCISFVSF